MSATKRQTESVGFQVHGDAVTLHARNLVKEGNWRDAVELLKEGLIGISDEYCYMILKGEAQLEGVNQVNLVEDDICNDSNWISEQYQVYFRKIFQHERKFYQPYSFVESLNVDDCDKALEENDLYSVPINCGGEDYVSEFNRMRAETYSQNVGDYVFYSEHQKVWIISKLTQVDYPIWLSKEQVKELSEESLTFNHGLIQKDLEELDRLRSSLISTQVESNNIASTRALFESNSRGMGGMTSIVDAFLNDMKESDHFHENIEEYKDKIREQADKKGGWLTLNDRKNNVNYKIPKNPFLRWCLTNNGAYRTIDWDCVSPRGAKTGMDDPNHTDWFIFTGLSMEDYSDDKSSNEFFSKMRTKYVKKLTNFDFVLLTNVSNHKGFKEAEIVHIKDPKEVDKIGKNQLVVIPEANPDFEMVAHRCVKNNSILITAIGGKLCHLAVVGREFKLSLIQIDNAFNRLLEGKKCNINLNEGTFEILDEDQKFLMQQKTSGQHFD